MTQNTYTYQESFMARTASHKSSPKSSGKTLGRLPVWDLSDLYPAPDSEALKSDLDAADKKARTFHKKYYAKVSGLSGPALGSAESMLDPC